MNGKLMLYVDQYGNRYCAKTVKELRSQIENGWCRVNKMYVGKTDGRVVHVGYVIGPHWFTAYVPYEGAA